jgi:hypothetical protein
VHADKEGIALDKRLHTLRISRFPIGYEEVRLISNTHVDVSRSMFRQRPCIMKQFEQISDEDLNKK